MSLLALDCLDSSQRTLILARPFIGLSISLEETELIMIRNRVLLYLS